MTAILLDTCAIIWIGMGAKLRAEAQDTLRGCDRLLVSAVSAWELQMLCTSRSLSRPPLVLMPDCRMWLQSFLQARHTSEVPLTIAIALDSQALPGSFHADPADRFLVATARDRNVPILTRDGRILAYAASGHVQAVAC